MTALIDGVSWSSSVAAQNAQVGNFGVIALQGSQNGTTIIITLYNIDVLGSYDLGMGPLNVGGTAQVSDITGQFWSTPISGSAGTLTLTTLTPTRIAGTFAFTADSSFGGARGIRAVTQGNFDLLLAQNGNTWPLPDQYGNILNGTVGGSQWKAANVVITLLGTGLVIAASNTQYSLSIGKTQFAGVGSYTLGNQASDPVVIMQGPGTNPNGSLNCCWGGGLGNTGTLAVTSLTATRIQGTLSATLQPMAGSAASGTLDLSNIAFDIGLP